MAGLYALSTVGGAAAAQAAPVFNGRVMFVTGGNSSVIWAVNLDGSAPHQVTPPGAGNNSDPTWSPDGKRVAFTSDRSAGKDIWLMNSDGSAETNLTSNGLGSSQPAWSPDGAHIAFVRPFTTPNQNVFDQVFVMNADGSGQTKVPGLVSRDEETPAWSPDGTTIAFAGWTANPMSGFAQADIYTVRPDGTGLSQLTNDDANAAPAWSPDGSKLVFVKNGSVATMNPDGTGAATLPITALTIGHSISWAPDGTELVYTGNNGGTYIAGADGSHPTRLVDSACCNAGSAGLAGLDPTWQPSHVGRLAGTDRITTAIAISQAAYNNGQAMAAVLSRADAYADALAGTPLALAKSGPLLLTPTDALDTRVGAEIHRALPTGSTVYLLGGTSALSDNVATQVANLGYTVVRYAGADRFATAVQITHLGLGDPSSVLLTTGTNFPDALGAGDVAASTHGAVLLTNGAAMPSATSDYLAGHPSDQVTAVGGPAAAADPSAPSIVGSDRYDTAAKLAAAYFPAPPMVAVASGENFPDALSGGALAAKLGGPLLLTPSPALPAPTLAYVSNHAASVGYGYLYGGTTAISDTAADQLNTAL